MIVAKMVFYKTHEALSDQLQTSASDDIVRFRWFGQTGFILIYKNFHQMIDFFLTFSPKNRLGRNLPTFGAENVKIACKWQRIERLYYY